jgi:hypothetical protein
MRRAQGTALVAMLWMALPAAGEAQTCVTACEAAAEYCAQRCNDATSEPFLACELACAQSYFVACFTRCVDTGEVVLPDPFAEESEAPEGC